MVRSEAAPDESLAAIRARIKLGIAIAAMIRMIATTISSSISEKPFCCFRISIFPRFGLFLNSCWSWNDAVGIDVRICRAKADSYLGSGWRLGNPLIFSTKPNYGLILRFSKGCFVPKCVAYPDNSCQPGTALTSLEERGFGGCLQAK